MDNLVPTPVVRFVPDRRITGLAAVGILAAVLVFAVDAGDAPGRLLAAIAVVLLAAYVVGDLLFSPRLEVSRDGLVIRAPTTRAVLAWSQVETVQADTRSRFGLRSTTLEIDAGDVLAVLSRRALGADPEQVAQVVERFRPG